MNSHFGKSIFMHVQCYYYANFVGVKESGCLENISLATKMDNIFIICRYRQYL